MSTTPKSNAWSWNSEGGFSSEWEWECESLVDSHGHAIIELSDIFQGYPECGEHLVMKVSPENARIISAAPDLLKAAMEAKKYLEPDLVEPGRTVFWKLVDAIKKATKKEGE